VAGIRPKCRRRYSAGRELNAGSIPSQRERVVLSFQNLVSIWHAAREPRLCPVHQGSRGQREKSQMARSERDTAPTLGRTPLTQPRLAHLGSWRYQWPVMTVIAAHSGFLRLDASTDRLARSRNAATGAKNHEALKKVAAFRPVGRRNRLPHRKHSVFHEVSRAERPSQQGRKTLVWTTAE
jgi:hypothetical protein